MTIEPTSVRSDALLWKRAGIAIIVGIVVFSLLGASLVAIALPGTAVANLVGVGLFVGLWSGPFFGTVIAVAYHGRAERSIDLHLVSRIPESPSISDYLVPAA